MTSGGKFQRHSWNNKYGNVKVEHAGRSFASKGESRLYDELVSMERAGVIKDIKQQDSVYLTDARILYKPDYRYLNTTTNALEWAEYKGFETPEWRIKRRLWRYYGPGPLHVYIAGRGGAVELKESIVPGEK